MVSLICLPIRKPKTYQMFLMSFYAPDPFYFWNDDLHECYFTFDGHCTFLVVSISNNHYKFAFTADIHSISTNYQIQTSQCWSFTKVAFINSQLMVVSLLTCQLESIQHLNLILGTYLLKALDMSLGWIYLHYVDAVRLSQIFFPTQNLGRSY